jgi:hypothetical protein
VLAHAPREHEVAPHLLARVTTGDLHPLAIIDVPVTVLDEDAAEHALVVTVPRRKTPALAIVQDPDRLFPPQ